MRIITSRRSPNYTELEIPVEFAVLHYTAAPLQRTLEIFEGKGTEVSAHIVIDRDGTIYEVVPCLDGKPLRAWHAGRSRWVTTSGTEQRLLEAFNDFSLGIELVNENGNIFPYTDAQYAALFALFERLKTLYPALQRPQSVVGHEQIAGFRGKVDPGRLFEWQRFFSVVYPGQGMPSREPRCPQGVAERLAGFVQSLGVRWGADSGSCQVPGALGGSFFEQVSSLLESTMADRE
jgi:N-acetylmuramoyl-L-alanine amidase